MHRLGVRWTIGDVSEYGFEALRLSILGAWRVFGGQARYAVCVNTLAVADVKARMGSLPCSIDWIDAHSAMPASLQTHLDAGFAEGVAWKFAPLQVFPDRKELALDNDCILWRMPAAVEAWLKDAAPSVLVAEDVSACYGRFAELCGVAPRNLGIRGLPPGFDLERALLEVLRVSPGSLQRELDEQGLQVAALTRDREVHVVSLRDVSIASPFGRRAASSTPVLARRCMHAPRAGAAHVRTAFRHNEADLRSARVSDLRRGSYRTRSCSDASAQKRACIWRSRPRIAQLSRCASRAACSSTPSTCATSKGKYSHGSIANAPLWVPWPCRARRSCWRRPCA